MKQGGVLAAVCGAVCSSVALSGGAAAQDETNGDGIYVRVGAGASFVGDLEQDFTFNPDGPVSFDAPRTGQEVDLGESFVVGAALGFNYTQGIRTELEYRYVENDVDRVTFIGGFSETDGPLPSATSFPDENIGLHLVMSNFYFDLNNTSRFTPFIGGGVGGAFVENENGDRDAALAYQGRAGVAYDFGGGLSFDIEYIYLRTNDLSFGPNDDEFTADGPSVRIDGDHYQSSSAMVSIRKQF